MQFKNLEINGKQVKFRNSDVNVMIPAEYKEKDEYLRAAWVSFICRDFKPSLDQDEMKKNLLEVIEYFKMMNMNAIMFHLRTYNNAYYKTKMAPIDPAFGNYETFEKWDYLPWFIEQCHKNGIEFHAWLNPYRLRTSGYEEGTTAADVANMFKDFPNNPASKKENILMTLSNGAILNPCKDEVIDYIIDVCLEIMKNYNVDAIHFDDYFYAQMSEKIDVINEPDQCDYLQYLENNKDCSYKVDDPLDKKQWRRDNIDKFIYKLSCDIRKFNEENNRQVQLGISPTGIYENGDGVVTYDDKGNAITSGSNTIGQEHRKSCLHCDTKKWVDNEWIDYIIPQSYWGFTHPVAGFADVMSWWDKVVEYKKVNLYSGMGIYMNHSDTTYSWADHKYEASDQVLYCHGLKNVKGTCVFSFRSFTNAIDNKDNRSYEACQKIKNEYWNSKIKTPKTLTTK